MARRQINGALKTIDGAFPAAIREEYQHTASVGTVLTLWARDSDGRATVGADELGQKGVPAEEIGRKTAEKLLQRLQSAGAVDEHLADNLIPLLALRGGKLRIPRITGHVKANMYVCSRFLDCRFTETKEDSGDWTVGCLS